MILLFPRMPRTEEPRRFDPVDPLVVADHPFVRALRIAAHVAAGLAIFVLLPVGVAVWRGWL